MVGVFYSNYGVKGRFSIDALLLSAYVEWLLHGKERNKAFPADRKMMEWLKDNPDVREQIWKMMEN